MSLILRQVIGYQQGRKAAPTTTPSEELTQTKKDLNSILNKWKWGEVPLRTSEEFLNKFEPWVNEKIKLGKELKDFLARYSVNTLPELANYMVGLSSGETANLELPDFLQLYGADSLEQVKETWQNTEQDYLKRIEELSKETPEDYETLIQEIQNLKEQIQNLQKPDDWEARTAQVITDLEKQVQELETEKDELTRAKITLEQEVLATNNRLNLKNQEVNQKLTEIQRLKQEKSQTEIALNKKLEELKKKYSKQGQLLDGEQVENGKLQDQLTQLNFKITSLETEKQRLIEELNQTE